MIEYITNYLKLSDSGCRIYDNIDKKYFNLTFQNEILKIVYPNAKSLITPIEQLDLEKNIFSVISIVLIFDFIYNKNKIFLYDLNKPIHFIHDEHLLLGNNAIRQLDILENFNINTKCKYRSLFHVINKTSTAIGERFLKSRILSPLTNISKLNSIYECIDELIEMQGESE